ncbi:hypothetical protein [Pseudonocardia sp.]|uniref:hypothetical protein n=1 Tax=Pseudonocardia sp. TaxID=60912 RepID=UPI003D1323D2
MPDDDLPHGLTRSDTAGPGWTRQRRGTGWSYSDDRGAIITDPLVRTRIGRLAIPPRRVGDVTSEDGSVDGRSRDVLDRAVVRLIRKG